MKKTTISFVIVLALVAAACGGNETTESTATTIAAGASAEGTSVETTTTETATVDDTIAAVDESAGTIDPETLDACLVFDTPAAEGLLGRPLESTEPIDLQAPPGVGCRWDAGWVDTDSGSYHVLIRLDVYAFPLSEIVPGEGCVQEVLTDLGDEASTLRCDGIAGGPASHTIAVHENGVSILLAVNPDRDVSPDEVRAEMERILASN